MKYPPGYHRGRDFAPQATDSLNRLLEKTEALLWFLHANQKCAPSNECTEDRIANAEALAGLLRRALRDPALHEDARIEAQAAWAREVRHSAMWTVTSAHHIRTVKPETRERWKREGMTRTMFKLAKTLERNRPKALKVLSTEDLAWLRKHGFLREGE